MKDVVIVAAARTPIGRVNGSLKDVHPVDLLAGTQRAVLDQVDLDPAEVGQIVGGCVNAIGEQTYNVARTAWLSAGMPSSVPGTTVDAQCGSSQQATNIAAALIAAGVVDVALACGVESMTRIPFSAARDAGYGDPLPPSYHAHHEWVSQFESAERIAQAYGIARADADAFGVQSQVRASIAWTQGRFEREVVPVVVHENCDETSREVNVTTDEGLRETTLDSLAGLRPVIAEGIHTAGTSSQISDGAAAMILMSARRASELNITPRATITEQCLVGVDPVLKLTGPIDATQLILKRAGLALDEIDLIEINEAFASVVLAWEKELHPDMTRVNPNGGAIALGHPLGASGARLMTTALHELERTNGSRALITMCCGGGLGTGTLIER